MSVLVVDDDRDLVDVITYILRRDGIEVASAFDGKQAWDRFQSEETELVVLDITMPGMDGVELLRRMRAESTVPVVMLTARQDEASIVDALDLGADDYITKPFSPRQLVARVRAVLRRASTYQPSSVASDRELRCGDLVLDTHLRGITRGETQMRLTPLEYRILHYLMINRGHVLASSAIVEHVWGYEGTGNEDLVKVHVHRLRQKLEPDPAEPVYLRTVPGMGYRLEEPATDAAGKAAAR